MNWPKVSVIILNWNGLEDTIECLESLKKISYPNYDVFVLDNGSEGEDADVLEGKYKGYIRLMRSDKNCGFTSGNNIIMKWLLGNSNPDYFLLLNNDTVVDPEFLTEMVKVAESDPQIGIVSTKVYLYHEPNRFQLVWFDVNMRTGQAFHTGSGEIDQGQYDEIREVNYVSGSCFLVSQRTVQAVGLLDESYFNYWDETDYFMRVKRAGSRLIYCPKAKIWHKVAQTSRKVTGLRVYYVTRNRFKFMKKYATRRQYLGFLVYFLAYYLWFLTAVHLIYHRDMKSLLSCYRGTKDGLLNKTISRDSWLMGNSKSHLPH